MNSDDVRNSTTSGQKGNMTVSRNNLEIISLFSYFLFLFTKKVKTLYLKAQGKRMDIKKKSFDVFTVEWTK